MRGVAFRVVPVRAMTGSDAGPAVTRSVRLEADGVVSYGTTPTVVELLGALPEADRAKVSKLLLDLGAYHRASLGHSLRVARISMGLARVAGLGREQVLIVGLAGLLHDVGKLDVDLAVLDKPGRLAPHELRAIQQHAIATLDRATSLSLSPPWNEAALIAGEHHERPDGSGYPRGKSGSDLGGASRIVMTADVADALAERRAYKPAIPMPGVLSMLDDMVRRGELPAGEAAALRLLHRFPAYPASHASG